jgi:hypothetical protein
MKTMMFLTVGLLLAEASTAAAPVDAGALGGVDAAIAFCTKINPAGTVAYGKLRESTIGEDVDPADVDAALQTPEYRQAYEATAKNSESQPHAAAVKTCSDLTHATVKRPTTFHPAPKPAPKLKPTAPQPAQPKAAANPPAAPGQ